MSKTKKVRHVLGISGGKDSAALAIYLKQQGDIPEMEYFCSDTGCELPETYEFIDKLEIYLGKKITRIGNNAPYEHHLYMLGNMLPSPRQRWCTVKMKLEPFEKFVGTDEVETAKQGQAFMF
ncbi:MAG: phosphoadenosine phosphosulfate reductase family protein [Thermodesulfobacteriota bacterium]|nr:phosphoadenosine phosphosulfate reductase family protein [Thermodesulfobacteriota bacterium]